MKIYSEITGQQYETVDACLAAEDKMLKEKAELKAKKEKLKEDRKVRAQEVDEAIKHAAELLNNFVKDYGAYHTSITDNDFSDFLFPFKKFWY